MRLASRHEERGGWARRAIGGPHAQQTPRAIGESALPLCVHPPCVQHPYDGVSRALMEDDVAHLGRVLAATDATLFVLDTEGRVLTRIW